MAEVAALRAELRGRGLPPDRVATAIASYVSARGWLGSTPAPLPDAEMPGGPTLAFG